MARENRDVATVFGDEYSRSAPAILGDQHEFLLRAVESHFLDNPDGTLLVVGPGGRVLPYSCSYTDDGKLGDTNRDRIKNMVGDGKIILMDYVLEEEKEGLEQGRKTLSSIGFFDEGYFKIGEFNPDYMCPESLEERTISFLKNNLRDTIRVDDNSIDVVEANLSVHHASVTRAELERVYKDFYRIMKPGGLLHLGEGNVDMNYSEDKIIESAQFLASILDIPIFVSDEREKGAGYVLNAFFQPEETYENLPVVPNNFQPPEEYVTMVVNEEGFINVGTISQNQTIIMENGPNKNEYVQGSVLGLDMNVPLIDPEIKKDIEGQIIPIESFYDSIEQRVVNGYAGVDDELVEQIIEGIEFERNNASRGIVEYYMGEQTIVDTLKRVGFTNIQVTHHETEPFYNILANKP